MIMFFGECNIVIAKISIGDVVEHSSGLFRKYQIIILVINAELQTRYWVKKIITYTLFYIKSVWIAHLMSQKVSWYSTKSTRRFSSRRNEGEKVVWIKNENGQQTKLNVNVLLVKFSTRESPNLVKTFKCSF